MNFTRHHISLLSFLVCGWVGIGAATAWGSRGLLYLLALGALWAWGGVSKRPWVGNLSLLLLVLIAIGGILKNTGELYFASGVIAALAVWDLERFALWLQETDNIHHKPFLIRRHLLRLGMVFGGSLLLLWFAFQVELQLTFWYAFLLIGVLLIGIHRFLRLFNS